mmetsp:Transcript_22408/g.88969  ORF Transcript_22408/g.88969 Transcript_22408/m.88969 type:complete len:299 (-) Transcript_22408:3-899(-)
MIFYETPLPPRIPHGARRGQGWRRAASRRHGPRFGGLILGHFGRRRLEGRKNWGSSRSSGGEDGGGGLVERDLQVEELEVARARDEEAVGAPGDVEQREGADREGEVDGFPDGEAASRVARRRRRRRTARAQSERAEADDGDAEREGPRRGARRVVQAAVHVGDRVVGPGRRRVRRDVRVFDGRVDRVLVRCRDQSEHGRDDRGGADDDVERAEHRHARREARAAALLDDAPVLANEPRPLSFGRRQARRPAHVLHRHLHVRHALERRRRHGLGESPAGGAVAGTVPERRWRTPMNFW